MCLAATIVSPLRSKRATISPLRPRANASGLTRIRVLSVAMARQCGNVRAAARSASASAPCGGVARARFGRLGLGDLGRDRRLVGRLAATPARRRWGWRARLGLTERADAPRRVDRLRARVAALLELAHARWAAQVVRLDLVVAVRAERVVQAGKARLRRGHLQLAQADVV